MGARLESLDLGEAVGRCAPRLEERAAQSGMSLALDLAGEPRPRVLADPTAFEQILFNLVDNACKYASGTEDKRIHIEASQHGRTATVRVRDHGPGISESDRRHLFSPFSKSAERAAASVAGVGLGLALCRRLARAMGGDLAVDPDRGAGAGFVLTLPAS